MVIIEISRDIRQLQIPPLPEEGFPKGEIIATPRTPQLILWDPVGSEYFSWGPWDFNLTGGIYPETCLIQDGSSPSLFRDQEIYLLSILETSAKLCSFFTAILRNLIPRKLILGVFIRMALICNSE